ncbi:hypothetical protein AUJ68_00650 [Candidatus Woesearchaeota archaeon CG1_02_57_44]|nr:MAG: hypothetical protein AUJ68_00650 [Candidatus Woesearchaeota archaeon CG1_02_57_44]PIN68452.1 MAG: 50S ribosomal protein L1 [Candidatus Woesearchaeota archaeon CG11_big_fil_rev_8_21_14_0_20_57_5]
MDKKTFIKVVSDARKESKKRNFSQKFDLIINLENIDLKKQQVDFYATLPHLRGKQLRTCALVGLELADEAKANCTKTLTQEEFVQFQKKRDIVKLADEFDFFIAQANIMAKVATVFGRVLGPRNKMPNPKAGCVVPPKTNLRPLIERLEKTVRVQAKKQLLIQVMVGSEEMPDDAVAENAASVADQLIHHLPGGKNNVKSMYLKTTMGKAVKVA